MDQRGANRGWCCVVVERGAGLLRQEGRVEAQGCSGRENEVYEGRLQESEDRNEDDEDDDERTSS